MNRSSPKPSIIYRVALYHLPFLAYATLILYLSSLSSLRQPIELPFGTDKVVHLVEYAIFAFLVFRSFTDLLAGRSVKLAVILSSVFILSFAVLDEVFQGTIPGRHRDPFDLAADFIGGVIILVLLGLRRSKQRFKLDQTEAKS